MWVYSSAQGFIRDSSHAAPVPFLIGIMYVGHGAPGFSALRTQYLTLLHPLRSCARRNRLPCYAERNLKLLIVPRHDDWGLRRSISFRVKIDPARPVPYLMGSMGTFLFFCTHRDCHQMILLCRWPKSTIVSPGFIYSAVPLHCWTMWLGVYVCRGYRRLLKLHKLVNLSWS